MLSSKKEKIVSGLVGTLIYALCMLVHAASDTTQQQRPPQGHPPAPPPEAVAACNGLATNAACNFVGRNKETVAGVCAAPPTNSQTATLACRPNRPPHGMSSSNDGGPPNVNNGSAPPSN